MNPIARIGKVLEETIYRLVATRRGSPSATRDAMSASREAWREISRGKWANAITWGKLAIASDPSHPDGYLMLGFAYAQSGQPEEGRRAYEEGVLVAPRDARLAGYLGELELDQHHWARAESAYRRAVELDPSQLSWRANLAHAVRMQDRFDEAAALLEALLEVAPHHAKALLSLGEVRSQSGDFLEAEDLMRSAIAADPTLAAAHYHLAWLLMDMERWDEALREAERALELNPGDTPSIELLARAEASVREHGRIG